MQQLKMYVAGAPALLMFQQTPEQAGKRGTILFYHGLSVAKETHIKELSSLANAGFLAIGIDNIGHGERRHPDFNERFSTKNPNWEFELLNDVAKTAEEVPRIIDELIRLKYSNSARLGISGISMGGFIAYAGIIADKRIQAAAPILGSPIWSLNHPNSPHKYIDRFFPCAVLSQNAGKDESVPPHHAREFHRTLTEHYQAAPERINYIEYAGEGHFMSEHSWDQLWKNVLMWFKMYL